MDFKLTEFQNSLRKDIVRFAQQNMNTDLIERDRNQVFPQDLWLKCGEMGFQGLPVDEKYGGSGFDALTTIVALEALGYGCADSGLVFSICAHLLSCVIPIWKYGTEDQKTRYLPDLCKGTRIAVNAMTEPESGSDAFSMRTKAERDGNSFKLNGTKTFSTNGPVGDVAVVFAATDAEKGYHGGITCFLVDRDTPGYRVGQQFEKMGLRTSPISELIFEDAWVPAEAVLGGVGGGSTLFTDAMNWERVGLFASHVGTIERVMERAVDQARTRKQFGKPIGKFQAISHKIADMKANLEAARLLTYKAATELERIRTATLSAAIAKLFVSETLVDTALSTIQIFGGYGFMTEFEVERALRDAIASRIYSGTSEMQRNIIAAWMGL